MDSAEEIILLHRDCGKWSEYICGELRNGGIEANHDTVRMNHLVKMRPSIKGLRIWIWVMIP